MHFFTKIKAPYFFLSASLLLGIFYYLFTPALQAPDEYEHFLRALSVSEGNFLPVKKDQRLGGEAAWGFDEFVSPYRVTAHNLKRNTSPEEILQSFKVDYRDSTKKFYDFPNTSYYSALCYLPQALSIYVLRSAGCSYGGIYYGARLFTLLFWIFLFYHLIRLLPVFQWLFTFLALLPMHIFMSNSFSADMMTNSLAFCFITALLKFSFDGQAFTVRRFLLLFVLVILIAFTKLVYAGLAIAVLIIPKEKFSSSKQYWLFAFVIIAGSFAAAIGWSQLLMSYYTPYCDYNPAFRDQSCVSMHANYYAQKEYILTHAAYFPQVIWRSLFSHPQLYLGGYIGILGANDNPLPLWVWIGAYLVILLLLFADRSAPSLRFFQRLILILSAACTFLLLLLSQHLTWDTPGEGVVDMIQGRYLIPVLPILFVACSRRSSWQLPLSALVLPASLLFNACALTELHERYFNSKPGQSIAFTCDGETKENGQFKTSHPKIHLEGGTQSDSLAHSGKYALRLSTAYPYALTYSFKGFDHGDVAEASAWVRGDSVHLVLSVQGKSCGDLFLANSEVRYSDAKGWKKIHFAVSMEKQCISDSSQARLFIWYTGKKVALADDLHVIIRKFDGGYLEEQRRLFE